MSICFSCFSALSIEETQQRIAQVRKQFPNIIRHFWISEVKSSEKLIFDELTKISKSFFIIQWNSSDGSQFLPELPVIFYEVFGADHILVYGNELELFRP